MFSRRQAEAAQAPRHSWEVVRRRCASWHALPPSAFPVPATGTLSKGGEQAKQWWWSSRALRRARGTLGRQAGLTWQLLPTWRTHSSQVHVIISNEMHCRAGR